ncbi:MAG: amidohydrolase family protein, partial [Actinomycetes bacterium]
TDYPHTDSTWPDTKELALELVQGLTQSQVNKVIRGNAIDLYGLSLSK